MKLGRIRAALLGLVVAAAGMFGAVGCKGGGTHEPGGEPEDCDDTLCWTGERCRVLDVDAYSRDRSLRDEQDGTPKNVCCSIAIEREYRDMGQDPYNDDSCGTIALDVPNGCLENRDCDPGETCLGPSDIPAYCERL